MSKIDRRLSATNDDSVKVYQYINYQNKHFLKTNRGGGVGHVGYIINI